MEPIFKLLEMSEVKIHNIIAKNYIFVLIPRLRVDKISIIFTQINKYFIVESNS